MILELTLKLIDRLIQLGERREKINRNLFTDFVSPIFSDFEKIHEEYLASFRKYREMIKMDESREQLEDRIKEDMLFTASSRSKLRNLEERRTDPTLGKFIQSIASYIRCDVTWPPNNPAPESWSVAEIVIWEAMINACRRNFMDLTFDILYNSSKPKRSRKEATLIVVDELVKTQQSKYLNVLSEYNLLKDRLLRMA